MILQFKKISTFEYGYELQEVLLNKYYNLNFRFVKFNDNIV